jgi:hypothetical protein
LQGRDDADSTDETAPAVLGQHPLKGRGQPLRDIGAAPPDRRHGRLDMGLHLQERGLIGGARERRLPGQQLVQRTSQRVDVGAAIDGVTVQALLGSHVVEGAQALTMRRDLSARSRPVKVPRQTQVEQPHLAGGSEHQVGRLDVAVNQPLLMEVLQPESRLPDHFTGFRHRQGAPLPDEPGQVVALDELQDEIGDARDLAGVIGRDQVGVRQANGQGLLLGEPRGDLGFACHARVAHLDGHDALPAEVARLVDDGHAAAAQLPEDFVTGQGRPDFSPRPRGLLVGRRRFRAPAGRG